MKIRESFVSNSSSSSFVIKADNKEKAVQKLRETLGCSDAFFGDTHAFSSEELLMYTDMIIDLVSWDFSDDKEYLKENITPRTFHILKQSNISYKDFDKLCRQKRIKTYHLG